MPSEGPSHAGECVGCWLPWCLPARSARPAAGHDTVDWGRAYDGMGSPSPIGTATVLPAQAAEIAHYQRKKPSLRHVAPRGRVRPRLCSGSISSSWSR